MYDSFLPYDSYLNVLILCELERNVSSFGHCILYLSIRANSLTVTQLLYFLFALNLKIYTYFNVSFLYALYPDSPRFNLLPHLLYHSLGACVYTCKHTHPLFTFPVPLGDKLHIYEDQCPSDHEDCHSRDQSCWVRAHPAPA